MTTETKSLMTEASGLLLTARALLEESSDYNYNNNHNTQETHMDTSTMNHPELTPDQAKNLYLEGRTVWEIAQGFGLTYAKTRKILASADTPIRSASARLKGRTRKTKKQADA